MDRFYRTQETPVATDQKEYLKKYLGNGKKKKKVKAPKVKGTRIVDDDVVATAPGEDADEGLLDAADERPQVAGGVPGASAAAAGDKRWKTLDECDLDELESQREILSESLKRLEGSGAPGASTSSDESPVKKSSQRRADSESSGGGLATSDSGSDSDAESVGRGRRGRHDSDSDSGGKKRRRYDSDESPVRRHERRPAADAQHSPAKRPTPRAGPDESSSRRRPPPRAASSDESPPRSKSVKGTRRRVEDSDESPERRRPGGESAARARHDSDTSPPRRRPEKGSNGASVPRRPDADGSVRSSSKRDDRTRPGDGSQRRERAESRSPRRSAGDDDRRAARRGNGGRDGSAESVSPPRSWRRPASPSLTDSPPKAPPTRTQDGRRAGLQDIHALREENKAVRRRDHNAIADLDESVSGRHAETKIRGRKLQEINEKAAKKAEEEAKAKERQKKYDAWGKGLKQAEDRRARIEHHQTEAHKPLARYADDDDLENELRRRQRQDDPMAEYMQRKKAKGGGPLKERPRYNKTEPPPNRYGIWPGYRWDGVDRSNGFEKQWFLRRNEKKARDTDAYKWSTEDM